MEDVIPAIEVETIKGVVANFNWKVVKQEITETDILVTIKKLVKATVGSESK